MSNRPTKFHQNLYHNFRYRPTKFSGDERLTMRTDIEVDIQTNRQINRRADRKTDENSTYLGNHILRMIRKTNAIAL